MNADRDRETRLAVDRDRPRRPPLDYERIFTDDEIAGAAASLARSPVTHRHATTTAERNRLATLVNHYETHLRATGRHWVITEAHRRADQAHDTTPHVNG